MTNKKHPSEGPKTTERKKKTSIRSRDNKGLNGFISHVFVIVNIYRIGSISESNVFPMTNQLFENERRGIAVPRGLTRTIIHKSGNYFYFLLARDGFG